jgi:hypothetical protein
MAELVTRVCDLCQATDAATVHFYSDRWGDWSLDLCEVCMRPILAARPREGYKFAKVALPPQPQ